MRMAQSTIASIAVMAGMACCGTSQAGIAPFELNGVEYSAGINTVIGSFQTDAGGELITGFTLSQAILETYDNSGQPNWAGEALIGFTVAFPDGSSTIFYTVPFENVQEYGTFGPVDISVDLSGYGLYVPGDGFITAYAISGWSDGTGQPAGMWTQGELDINYVPGPGSLALLLVAGVASRRRRRE